MVLSSQSYTCIHRMVTGVAKLRSDKKIRGILLEENRQHPGWNSSCCALKSASILQIEGGFTRIYLKRQENTNYSSSSERCLSCHSSSGSFMNHDTREYDRDINFSITISQHIDAQMVFKVSSLLVKQST